ncbi:MAG TPA: zinc ABC transporter substrate-binding protein [Fibrobacteria bacterium]|nr:zinc ABC transporter substrate-binding protein [Fibrobacteria bacterium]HOX50038.1 zinc ABC transporter substrate-binding protein [Fibrobacteria bacterium]
MATPNPTRLTWLALAAFGLVSCKTPEPSSRVVADSSGAARADTAQVVFIASVWPVARLGCDLVGDPCRPVGLVPAGASAHSWEPKPSDLQTLQGATAYLEVGLEFEHSWIPRFQSSVPDLRVLDLSGALDLSSHEEGHPHRGGEPEADPHVWSSPRALKLLVSVLAEQVSRSRPDLAPRVQAGLPVLRSRLETLDSLARVQLSPFSGKSFLINHPGLGYFARDYGLVQRPLESHGREMTPVTLFEIRKTARAQGVRAVFLQSGSSPVVATQVAKELGVPVVEVDLLSPMPYDTLFLRLVGRMASSL